MRPNAQETAGLFTFTKAIFNGKLRFLCSVIDRDGRHFHYIWNYTRGSVTALEDLHLMK